MSPRPRVTKSSRASADPAASPAATRRARPLVRIDLTPRLARWLLARLTEIADLTESGRTRYDAQTIGRMIAASDRLYADLPRASPRPEPTP